MYLHWRANENPNIFSYLDGQHTKWRLFCNYLKLMAWALSSCQYLIENACPELLDRLIADACGCICEG